MFGMALTDRDQRLAQEFSRQRTAAEQHLWREMRALGMHPQDGWKISESTREVAGGMELVLRPIHLYLAAPQGLECVVRIEEPVESVETDCRPMPMPRR
jgi:hypothetical protein